MSITAKLKNAEILKTSLGDIARGQIYGDVHRRFDDGEWIRTSYIKSVDGNIVTTRNSVYECEWAAK